MSEDPIETQSEASIHLESTGTRQRRGGKMPRSASVTSAVSHATSVNATDLDYSFISVTGDEWYQDNELSSSTRRSLRNLFLKKNRSQRSTDEFLVKNKLVMKHRDSVHLMKSLPKEERLPTRGAANAAW